METNCVTTSVLVSGNYVEVECNCKNSIILEGVFIGNLSLCVLTQSTVVACQRNKPLLSSGWN